MIGQKEAAEMKEQMTLFAKELGELKATISQQQDDTYVSRAGKKRVPRDLSARSLLHMIFMQIKKQCSL